MTTDLKGWRDELRLMLLRWMVVGREIDKALRKIDSHWHEVFGEEAVIVGSFLAMRPTDVVIPHYRGPLIASTVRGADLRRLFAGIFGKVTGPTRGRWRVDTTGEVGPNQLALFSGCLGPSLAYAAGAALAAKLQRTDRVAMVTFGDGTVGTGLFHESINLASMLKLPAIFVCQDNQYAISTPSSVSIPGSLLQRAAGYGMKAVEVDGNDAVAVYDAVSAAAEDARAGAGATFIHALTYRRGGHWATDPMAYRSREEEQAWEARDPVLRLSRVLVAEGVVSAEALEEMAREAAERVARALADAQADPWPGADVLAADAYAPN